MYSFNWTTWFIRLFMFAALSFSVQATPPPIVDGQPLHSLAPMLENVTPAVVNISSQSHVQVRDPFFDDPVFRHFFGDRSTTRMQRSLGSGVIIDAKNGYIITNHHVIADSDSITVTLHDGRHAEASIVGSDPDTDLALIEIATSDLSQLPVADSKHLRVGDFVAAVGNPFGLGQSVTYGIISALGRSGLGDTYQNFIQTDTAINPGNSGGALINLKGELIGINSMIYSPSGASAGISFAIPSNLVEQVVTELLAYGEVRRGTLGLDVQPLNSDIAQALKLQDDTGVLVTAVRPGSSAAKAGVTIGDVILKLNDKRINSPQELRNMEGLLTVGDAVQLHIWRHGKQHTLKTSLHAEELARTHGADLDARLEGLDLRDLSRREQQNTAAGVMVNRVTDQKRAARSGLRKGDIIIALNRRRVRDLAALRALLLQHPAQLELVIIRNGRQYYVSVS